ncbi:MAG: glutamate-5-semialdehyde dehydrogenase [Cyanobacteria bacterium]|nr:glutamate-5-semialdehyde dehydrogenase [Cyanobacteriota bacterium]MDW8200370.1 glutamate-5-semialdehyde dehydrogenase [Cyanobacteriota bacterium SKYGB_h_bin112]
MVITSSTSTSTPVTAETTILKELAQRTRLAARQLAGLSVYERNQALMTIADTLDSTAPEILAANAADCAAAEADGLASALCARLKLNAVKLRAAIAGVRDVAALPDPIGTVQLHRELDDGLVLTRIACPLGVLGVIFEARPDAVIQIAALAIKSGNGAILKGGREAIRSCEALVSAIRKALLQTSVNPDVIQLLTTREEIRQLLELEEYVDLIIPRGSNSFVRYVQDNTRIPVLGHADGICHLYVDAAADVDKAVAIAVDAKTQYPAACNAIETLLVHQAIAPVALPAIAQALYTQQVELRGDADTCRLLAATGIPINPASDADWATEYLDLILSIRVVESLDAAITHIETYGSKHTEAIVTEDPHVAQTFLAQVDAAGVYHNCSTRFADGFRYGFGAEVGISTNQLPPRGPVGLEGLVTYKYQLVGNGHIVATYTGSDAKPFTHRDLKTLL